MLINKMTQYLMLVASSIDNYCKDLGKNTGDCAPILGYVYRLYQDKIKGLSPQGIGLLVIYLKEIDEKDYPKYIDIYAKEVDKIINESKTIEEQIEKMDKLGVRLPSLY